MIWDHLINKGICIKKNLEMFASKIAYNIGMFEFELVCQSTEITTLPIVPYSVGFSLIPYPCPAIPLNTVNVPLF